MVWQFSFSSEWLLSQSVGLHSGRDRRTEIQAFARRPHGLGFAAIFEGIREAYSTSLVPRPTTTRPSTPHPRKGAVIGSEAEWTRRSEPPPPLLALDDPLPGHSTLRGFFWREILHFDRGRGFRFGSRGFFSHRSLLSTECWTALRRCLGRDARAIARLHGRKGSRAVPLRRFAATITVPLERCLSTLLFHPSGSSSARGPSL